MASGGRMRFQNFALNFTDANQWNQWWSSFKRSHPELNTTITNFDSFCSTIGDVNNIIEALRKIQGNKHANAEKDALIAKAILIITKNAGPVKLCAWLVNENYVTVAINWFEKNSKAEDVAIWDVAYEKLMRQLPMESQVRAYQRAAIRFRKETGLPDDIGFAVLTGQTPREWRVTKETAMDIQAMLIDMISRRRTMTGGNRNKEQSRENGTFIAGLVKGEESFLGDIPWRRWNKKNEKGLHISSTALMNAIQRGLITEAEVQQFIDDMKKEGAAELDEDIKKGISEMLDALEAFKVEKPKMSSTTTTGGYVQQGSNMDIIFSSFYWVWKSGCNKRDFPALSKFLNNMGQKIVGKTHMIETLETVKFKWGKGLINIISTEGFADKVHMHPAVLTCGRINNEMVACFGVVPAHKPDLASSGCASIRHLTNFETRQTNAAAVAITSLFRVFKAAYPQYDQEEIVPAEHMLHQSFLGKYCAFQNASQLDGDALDVILTEGN
ncbi:nucleoprotein [Great Saltee virus]|uniref:Nucleoprotein n=1 Tax=Great Saltee virus TaxID=1810946 RepID=A0A191KWA9_9VIRU|nr:nucleoprotein [Great Saltee virus]AMT75406.1 nucleoprotein [Great Saltee virus]